MPRVILFLAAIFLGAFQLKAQTDVFEQIVHLQGGSTSIREVLIELEKETGLSFAYNSRLIPVDKSILLNFGELKLLEALELIFSGEGVGAQYVYGQILLYKEEENLSEPNKQDYLSRIEQKVIPPKFKLSGKAWDNDAGLLLPGVNVYVEELKRGTVSDEHGAFELNLPSGFYTLEFSYIGYCPVELRIKVHSHLELEVYLEDATDRLGEVVVVEPPVPDPTQEIQMSKLHLKIEELESLPTFLGEKDAFRVMQLMPGVQSGKEGQSGLFVRGGRSDQNLVLLDGVPIYRPQHLLGLFSSFDGDALQEINLLKGGFPARYGGRLSSVVDVKVKPGNKEKIKGGVGLGLASVKANLEGPIGQSSSTFYVSARRSFWDLLTKPLSEILSDNEMSIGYHFKDINAKWQIDLGDSDRLSITAFRGDDQFRLKEFYEDHLLDIKLRWGNSAAVANWRKIIGRDLVLNSNLGFTQYKLDFNYDDEVVNGRYQSKVIDLKSSTKLACQLNDRHSMNFGLEGDFHQFIPRSLTRHDSNSDSLTFESRSSLKAYSLSLFVENDFRPLKGLEMNLGLRLVHFRQSDDVFWRLEPRLSTAYTMPGNWVLKAAFARMGQNQHLLSGPTIGLPLDFWIPASEAASPQTADQYSLGVVKDIASGRFEASVELYQKKFRNILIPVYNFWLPFGESSLTAAFQEPTWQNYFASGTGKSKGIELLWRKKTGSWKGWLSYTLSWTRLRSSAINQDNPFWANYDRRHELGVASMVDINENINISATWVWASGLPWRLPVAQYKVYYPNYGGTYPVREYEDWNSNRRTESYHRLDLNISFLKEKESSTHKLSLGVYNAYLQRNPFFYITTENEEERLEVRKISIFPIVPSVSYHIAFK